MGKGRNKKQTASGRPRQTGPKNVLERQRILSRRGRGSGRARPAKVSVPCSVCEKMTTEPNTFGQCPRCGKRASKKIHNTRTRVRKPKKSKPKSNRQIALQKEDQAKHDKQAKKAKTSKKRNKKKVN